MDLEKEVLKAIGKYNLFSKEDRVGVAVSGGKDSVVLLSVLKKLGFDVVAIMLDLEIGDWSRVHRENVERFCLENDIELRVFGFWDFFSKSFGVVIGDVAEGWGVSRCSVCGVAKKWGLNRFARECGVDVLATGHNADDECQNVLMNFLKGNIEIGSGFGPKTGSRWSSIAGQDIPSKTEGSSTLASLSVSGGHLGDNKISFVQRVKPLFFVSEGEILRYSKKMGFGILYDACPNAVGTYRVELRRWMDENLSDSEKIGIVRGFMKRCKEKGVGRRDEVGVCERCGEVCRRRVCGFCELVDSYGGVWEFLLSFHSWFLNGCL